MSLILNQIYDNSPILFQNLMVSIYGYKLHKQRYGGNSKKYIDELMQSQWLSNEDLTRLQNEKLRNLINHAYNTVPYYQKLFKQERLTPEDIREIADLSKIPILEKNEIKKNPIGFRSSLFSKEKDTFCLDTSGSTGKPITIYCDSDSRRLHYAFFNRLRSWNNISIGVKRITFAGRTIIPPNQTKKIFWRRDINENNWLFSSYHMSEDNLKYYYEKIIEIQPDEINSYPSSLFLLAKYMFLNDLSGVKPKAIITSAETLLDHQRKLIEDIFECKICDQYGCTEMAHFISQCEYGTYHMHPEFGIIEVVDKEGNIVQNEKQGEIICTSFINKAMPLIRYRLGDSITLSNKKCSCGRNFPVVSQIIGRTDDILITPDGRPLGRLDPVFKGMNGLNETQIVQTAIDTLAFYMVTDNNFSKSNLKALKIEIQKRVGYDMILDFIIVKNIPKDKNGKFRSVISRI